MVQQRLVHALQFPFFFFSVSCQSWTGSSDVDMVVGTVRDITIIPANTRDLKISLQAQVTWNKTKNNCFSIIKLYKLLNFGFLLVQVDIDLQLYVGATHIAGYDSPNAGDGTFEYNVNFTQHLLEKKKLFFF